MFRLEVTGSVHRMHEVSNGFYLDKMAAIMLTTGVSLACAGYLFLGSRLGNSLLLRFASREVGQARRVESHPARGLTCRGIGRSQSQRWMLILSSRFIRNYQIINITDVLL